MKEIELFGNQFGDIRTFQHETELYFVGIDVAKALGYKDVKDALDRHCNLDIKIKGGAFHPPLKLEIDLKDANGRMQTYRLIDEPNLYKLIFASRLDSARDFTSWVAGDVLPTIRKFGCYPKQPDSESLLDKVERQAEAIHHIQDKMQKAIENPEASASMARHDLYMDWYEMGWVEFTITMVPRHKYKITPEGAPFLYKPKGSKAIRLRD